MCVCVCVWFFFSCFFFFFFFFSIQLLSKWNDTERSISHVSLFVLEMIVYVKYDKQCINNSTYFGPLFLRYSLINVPFKQAFCLKKELGNLLRTKKDAKKCIKLNFLVLSPQNFHNLKTLASVVKRLPF